jgi:NADP-dependent 3-hydroxy acid dehydrogenase YdfG
MSQTILITGSSSGIGNATARLFQAEGWNVVATMRNPDAGSSLASLDGVLVSRLDVTDSASIQSSVSEGIKRFGRIDALVNNAGYGAYGPLEAFDMDGIRRQFDTNVLGLLDVTKAVLPGMRAQGDGTIVNISSIGGQMAFPLGALYHGTKFAVEGLSEALQYELSEVGVRVKIVEPGLVATDFGGRSFDFREGDIPAYKSAIESMGKGFGAIVNQYGISTPEDIAQVIFRAVTDGTRTLRYTAGGDAEALISDRKTTADGPFFGTLRKLFSS